MTKLVKLFFLFLLFSSMVLMVSPIDSKNKTNIINYKDTNTLNEASQAKLNFKTNFNPVLKLTRLVLKDDSFAIAGSATGVSIKYDRKAKVSYILTNHHFCENNTEYEMAFTYSRSTNTNGGSAIYLNNDLQFVYSDKEKDLCMLKTYNKIVPVKISKVKPKPLDKVYIIGAPKGMFPIILETYISGYIDREMMFDGAMGTGGNKFILISEIIFGGHSGSPIFNKDGNLVGVVFANFKPGYGGFGIGVEDIQDFIKDSRI